MFIVGLKSEQNSGNFILWITKKHFKKNIFSTTDCNYFILPLLDKNSYVLICNKWCDCLNKTLFTDTGGIELRTIVCSSIL